MRFKCAGCGVAAEGKARPESRARYCTHECASGRALQPRERKGYGHLKVDGVVARASRVALELTVGPLPAGTQALHRCDNPPCCNPEHLFVGTNQDNAVDREAKGRGRWARSRKMIAEGVS